MSILFGYTDFMSWHVNVLLFSSLSSAEPIDDTGAEEICFIRRLMFLVSPAFETSPLVDLCQEAMSLGE